MWTPTHVQVTVQRAKGLLIKGKNGANDAFVTICLGKEKYQTSVKERVTDPVDWHEECELAIPRHGNKAEIVLTVLHRNFIGDEFLGMVTIPLSDFDHYDKPKNRWYALKCKPGQDKTNYRGEIEVRVSFTVQSGVSAAGSLSELKKDGIRASFGQLSQKVGGSLLSLKGKGDKKGLKGLAKAVGNKVSTLPGRGSKKKGSLGEAQEGLGLGGGGGGLFRAIPEGMGSSHNLGGGGISRRGEADPGVISDEEEDEFRFDELSHKSSHSSLSVSQVALQQGDQGGNGSLENLGGGEFLRRNYGTPPPGKLGRMRGELLGGKGDGAEGEGGKKDRWSTGPVDDWETKLFGAKQGSILGGGGSLKRGGGGATEEREESKDKEQGSSSSLGSGAGEKKKDSFPGELPFKPTFQSIFQKENKDKEIKDKENKDKDKEPTPKPRNSASNITSTATEGVDKSPKKNAPQQPEQQQQMPQKVKMQAPSPPQQIMFKGNNNSTSSISTEDNIPTPPSTTPQPSKVFSQKVLQNNNNNLLDNKASKTSTPPPPSSTLIKEASPPLPPSTPENPSTNSIEELHSSSSITSSNSNQKWTPVGITNPIRHSPRTPPIHGNTPASPQKDSHISSSGTSRLPREILKKFEGKSREDLVELIMKQQSTLEYQRQKLNDMEDYIDNLLVRVMENKPTLLQTPYLTRPMKFSAADDPGDWFALSTD